ncbi:MAG: hypothetical protein DHS20C18_33320 [Saprospiraceae bacterium]|nr:MAG: hypothetical protein DHS20C18_33320 [Saprospiraceae bacterium]
MDTNWPSKVRNNFIDKLDRSMETISQMPYSFPASQDFPGLRKCVITSRTTAYYRVDETKNEVEIITVINNRQ